MTIFIKYKNNVLFTNRDYNFSFKFFEALSVKSKFFAHIMFVNVVAIQIKNALNTFFVIFKNMRINDLYNYEKKNCNMINIDNRYFIVVLALNWIKRAKWFAKYIVLTNLIIVNIFDDAILFQSLTFIVTSIIF